MRLTFTAPTRPLSINEANRMHWAARRRRLQPWALATEAAYKTATKKERAAVEGKRVKVSVTLSFPRAGRRDPHNYTSTVVKTIVDALVRAGLVPDDTPEWLETEEPLILLDKSEQVEIVVAPATRKGNK